MNGWGNETVNDKTTLRAGIYLRVSTLDQKEGHGIELQKTKCEAMATVKGWTITKVYMDEGISGTIKETDRPGFSQLIYDAKQKLIDAVIVYALDRLGRKTQIVLRTIENLAEMGIKLVSCRENLDTSTAAGTFMVTIFAALSQLDRDTIVERMKAGTEERRKIDGDIGGHMPMGYERACGTVLIVEEKAKIVRHIFYRRYIDFRFMYQIADELNEKDVPRPTKRGKVWAAAVVQRILDNEGKYLGGYRNRSKFRWPRILPVHFEEQERSAKEKRKERSKLRLPSTGTHTKKERTIKRSKRGLAQLQALRKGEVIPKSTEELKPPKIYKEKTEIQRMIPRTPTPPRKSALRIRIPSPEAKKRSPSKGPPKGPGIRIASPIPIPQRIPSLTVREIPTSVEHPRPPPIARPCPSKNNTKSHKRSVPS